MGIQSSINSAIGSLTVAGAVKKYGDTQKKAQENQKAIKDNVKDVQMSIDEGNEINKNEKAIKLSEGIGFHQNQLNNVNARLLKNDAELNDTEVDAMKTIDDFYTAQENGQMTDKQAYQKALQTYKDKIEMIRRQNEGAISFKKTLLEKRQELISKRDELLGGKK